MKFDWRELKLSAAWDASVSESLARAAWEEYDASPKSGCVLYNSARGTLDRFRLPAPIRSICDRLWWEMVAHIDQEIRAQDDCARVIHGEMSLKEWKAKWE